jgi:hypothetical protein
MHPKLTRCLVEVLHLTDSTWPAGFTALHTTAACRLLPVTPQCPQQLKVLRQLILLKVQNQMKAARTLVVLGAKGSSLRRRT